MVPIRMQNLPFEVLQISRSQATCHTRLKTKEPEDCSYRDVTGNKFLNCIMLVRWISSRGNILLNFERPSKNIRTSMSHDLFGKVCVDFKAVVLSLISRKLVNEFSKL